VQNSKQLATRVHHLSSCLLSIQSNCILGICLEQEIGNNCHILLLYSETVP